MEATVTATTKIDDEARARVKATCYEKLHSAIEILSVAELLDEKIERPGYWERVFIVAWKDEAQSCTHRICINEEKGECMWGHYFMGDDGTQAIEDMMERTGGVA